MQAHLVCASHSPLMLTGIEESRSGSHQRFFAALDDASAALHAFRPDLVVVFAPDHFNGFFYDLMPAFCVGTAAEGSRDWGLDGGALKVPRALAMDLVRHLLRRDFDVALSHEMRLDHGATVPLIQLTGALARYDVLPVFVNCAADPRPSFRRVRAFAVEIGRFLAERRLRVAFLGSGGLSHDPPTPLLDRTSPELARRLIRRATPEPAEYAAREARVLKAARALVAGKGPCLPPDEAWDRAFLERLTGFDTAALDAYEDEGIDRAAGFGAHEVRTWVAALAAAREYGPIEARVCHYELVPEWLTGMGIVSGTTAGAAA